MSSLPSGTVTFLMSDVESSTALWFQHRGSMDRAMADLDVTICNAVRRHGGFIIQSRGEGDSHFGAFDRASGAVFAAIDVQRALAGSAWPRVRIAIHTAEAVPVADDYLGGNVNAAARLRATAHGGQIVCSRSVVELVSDRLQDAGVELRSLGSHRLRDVPAPVELFQVCAPGIPSEFPPLATLDSRATALMAIVVADQVGSADRVRHEGRPAVWQRPLFQRLRAAAHHHDGRFVKLVGDGCMAAFEDPRAALAFARELCEDASLSLAVAVTAGLVEVVEGELSGEVVFEAFVATRGLEPGTVWESPIVAALIGFDHRSVAAAAHA